MTYQEYLRRTNELTAKKNELYDIASQKWGEGDKAGQEAAYAEIDEVQAELDALVNPNEDGPADDLAFDDDINPLDVGTYEDVQRKHRWMKGTY
jgi:hypothetical protein